MAFCETGELKFWENFHPPQHVMFHVSHVMCQMSRVRCHMSCVTCYNIYIYFLADLFFFTKWWSLSVEGLLSMGPTPSSSQRWGLASRWDCLLASLVTPTNICNLLNNLMAPILKQIKKEVLKEIISQRIYRMVWHRKPAGDPIFTPDLISESWTLPF